MTLNERQTMLKKVQAASFALDDLKLYLDTHPTDKKALSAFAKYQDEYERALAEYTAKYGALKMCIRDRFYNAGVCSPHYSHGDIAYGVSGP